MNIPFEMTMQDLRMWQGYEVIRLRLGFPSGGTKAFIKGRAWSLSLPSSLLPREDEGILEAEMFNWPVS